MDHDLHFHGGAREPQFQVRVPAAAQGPAYGRMRPTSSSNAKEKFGKEPKDLRVAIIHEDGAYGVDVSKGDETGARKHGFNIVMKEGYPTARPTSRRMVTKLKRARPDVIFHTGYNPDITLLLRQAREQGLKFGALVGQGAGYGVYEKLKESLGTDANYLFNIDPISIWLANPKTLDPSLPPLIKMVGDSSTRSGPASPFARHMSARRRRPRICSCRRSCRAPSRSMAASTRRRCARRRSSSTCRKAPRCKPSASSSRGLSHLGGPEYPRLSGHHPVRRRQGSRGVAAQPAAARTGAASAVRHDLQLSVEAVFAVRFP